MSWCQTLPSHQQLLRIYTSLAVTITSRDSCILLVCLLASRHPCYYTHISILSQDIKGIFVIDTTVTSQIISLAIVYLTRLFRHRSKKTPKFRVTGFCVGNSPVTGEFPTQTASNTEYVSIWWRYHKHGGITWWFICYWFPHTVRNCTANTAHRLIWVALLSQNV